MDAADSEVKWYWMVNPPELRFRDITPSCITARFVWLHLPLELRLTILECLSRCQRRRWDRRAYASVCKEWQMFFELQTFKSLRVTSSDLDALDRIVTAHRRQAVKFMKFTIHLSTYTCADGCDKPESQSTIQKNNTLFTKALWELLSILAKWDIVSDQPTLRLQIEPRSKSDQAHGFQALGNNDPMGSDEHDDNSSTTRFSVSGSAKRVLLNQLDLTLDPGAELPKVPIIRDVIFPWNSFRSLSAESLESLLGCLPRLQMAVYGAIQGINQHQQERRNVAMSTVLNSCRPSIREILVYEALATEDARRHTQGSPPPDLQRKGCNPQLVSAAVEASYRLEILAITEALNVDAESFFQHIEAAGSHQSWPALKGLALYTYSSSSSDKDVNRLGLAAAKVALRMSEMRDLAIRSGEKGADMLLRYRAWKNPAELTVSARNLDPDVVKAWKKDARRSGARSLEMLYEA